MRILPSEWYPQSGIQLTWPHERTDWRYMLEEAYDCFIHIASAIAEYELLLIVTPDPEKVKKQISKQVNLQNTLFFQCETNDTWARDHGAISVIEGGETKLLDFTFNGWGLKFAADADNQITRKGFKKNIFKTTTYENRLNFILEGGSIESDGGGTLLTTSQCLLSANRNAGLTKEEIEVYLKETFNLTQVLWLDYGYLAGDDTDSHIDTLARLCPGNTIAYIQCKNTEDEHYTELANMEKQLRTFRTPDGRPYQLIPLPMCDPIYAGTERLPATYANFLVINGAVLYPTYRQPGNDKKAGEIIKHIFPNREIIGIDCMALIQQHGSLHCVTMQYPEGVL